MSNTMKCLNCEAETQNPKFCSRSCSASYTNKTNPKRKLGKTKCTHCSTPIHSGHSYCKSCYKKKSTFNKYGSLTIQDVQDEYRKQGHHPSRWNARVRLFNRSWNKELTQQSCRKCGYSLHVDLCHIKPVSSFPLTTPLSVVNSKDNIIPLCKNCHWEFDNGLLKL